MIKIGVIADDFTGATDIASFLVENGLPTVQINGVPTGKMPEAIDALVISLKTRSCPVVEATQQSLAALSWLQQQDGYRYAVLDALTEHHLEIQGEALRNAPLVTGGSGLAIGLARQWTQENGNQARKAGHPLAGRGVVLSGSCSQMTNRQVAHYRQIAPAREVDVARCLSTETLATYAHELAEWVLGQESVLAPLVFATASTDALAAIQQQYGAQKASQAVETLFSQLAARLAAEGVARFIVAGGETSGVVTQSLGIKGFHIGPTISPGVPWVNALDKPVSLALKSGNFGDEAFFSRAQREFLS